MTDQEDSGAWFAEKRFGYGAGLPITWQGWAALGGYIGLAALLVWLIVSGSAAVKVTAMLVFALATAAFVETTRRHTRGGWKWRWGKDD